MTGVGISPKMVDTARFKRAQGSTFAVADVVHGLPFANARFSAARAINAIGFTMKCKTGPFIVVRIKL
jgi:hypothetical protein